MTLVNIPTTIDLGGYELRVFKGVMEGWERTEIEEGVLISVRFRITHLNHFCIVCGWKGAVRLLGTFISPSDKREYPYCLCAQHDPESVKAAKTPTTTP